MHLGGKNTLSEEWSHVYGQVAGKCGHDSVCMFDS